MTNNLECNSCHHDIEQHEKHCNGYREGCILYHCGCLEFVK